MKTFLDKIAQKRKRKYEKNIKKYLHIIRITGTVKTSSGIHNEPQGAHCIQSILL